ncbi:hypothetical protein PG993_014417 [Apiospora rasikravindrae]|uniref:DUF6594 domain-containing protein n=1 Tax=Apiospora rasikravindrae TaxID=990691 RepID=A0ABR1RMR5_9PEZI
MKGYAKIGSFMGEQPETAMVRRFAELNLQNILYLQAEIVGLEEDLRRLETQNDSKEDLHLDWYSLAHADITTDGGPEANKQWATFTMLRRRLKEYNEAVMAYCALSQLPRPPSRDVQKFEEWLKRPSLGDVYLRGRDRDVWARGEDLMCLQRSPHGHRFSGFIARYVIPLYHSLTEKLITFRNRDSQAANTTSPTSSTLPSNLYVVNAHQQSAEVTNGIYSHDDSRIVMTANLIGTIAASILPVLSIAILYTVRSMAARLGLVAVFSALFSTCLWFMNDGNLVEVFGATSAFAAVQVVFIGTSGSS